MDEKTKPIIELNDVSKEYTLYKSRKQQFVALFHKPKSAKQHMALDHVSFQMMRGESVGIIGKNGAGKSTLLKMITGVAFPTKGEVKVRGKVAALLELTAGFFSEMTGRENIHLKGQLLGLGQEEIKRIEPDIIEFAQLGDYIDQPIRTYSSGMKMRLGFAININIQPDILVVDEALSVGDAQFRKKCTDKVADLIAQGVTVLFVSHSAKSIQEVCKRAIYLKKGKMVFDGDVKKALELYQNDTKPAAKKKA